MLRDAAATLGRRPGVRRRPARAARGARASSRSPSTARWCGRPRRPPSEAQWRVGRELRRRLTEALERGGHRRSRSPAAGSSSDRHAPADPHGLAPLMPERGRRRPDDPPQSINAVAIEGTDGSRRHTSPYTWTVGYRPFGPATAAAATHSDHLVRAGRSGHLARQDAASVMRPPDHPTRMPRAEGVHVSADRTEAASRRGRRPTTASGRPPSGRSSRVREFRALYVASTLSWIGDYARPGRRHRAGLPGHRLGRRVGRRASRSATRRGCSAGRCWSRSPSGTRTASVMVLCDVPRMVIMARGRAAGAAAAGDARRCSSRLRLRAAVRRGPLGHAADGAARRPVRGRASRCTPRTAQPAQVVGYLIGAALAAARAPDWPC